MLAVWTRAIVGPAWRRATAVWVGAGIGGGIVFGPTGMHPADLTRLALGVPAVGLGLAVMWLLVFIPTARLLVRGEAASYLRSLPWSRWWPPAIAAVALVGLQLPWLLLWLVGDGARGGVIVLAMTVVIAAVAAIRPHMRPVRWPHWPSGHAALRGVYVRALRRRASDGLVRGAGLAILAGLIAALVVRNNQLAGRDAAALGAGTIAIVLVPGWAGALLPLVEAQRATAWLASSLGLSTATRVLAATSMVVAVYLGGTVIALGAAAVGFSALLGGLSPSTLGWLAGVSLLTSLGLALFAARAVVAADRARSTSHGLEAHATAERDGDAARGLDRDVAGAPVRAVTGAITASALAVVVLGWLGVAGAGVLVAAGACALLTARPA